MKSLLIVISILFLSMQSYASGFPAKEVYEAVSPSVVVIKASKQKGVGIIGAGSIISDGGLIITNAHVVIDKETNRPYSAIRVYLKPEELTGNTGKDLSRYYRVQVLRYSTPLDLALLKAEGLSSGIKEIELADPSEIRIGEEVVAIGHPEQGGFWSLTYGRISGEMKDYRNISGKDVYQTDTSVNRGNSGGPLLDRRGYMVGINSTIARLGKGGLPITGVNFAIKSAVVRRWLDESGYMVAYGKAPLTGDKGNKRVSAVEPPETFEPQAVKGVTDTEVTGLSATHGKLLTPERPYNYDEVLMGVAKELEEMMEEMRKDIRGERDVPSIPSRASRDHSQCLTEDGLKVCIAEGEARLGEDTTPAVARAMALNKARRNALEKAGVKLRSTSYMYNGELVSEYIEASTEGVIVKEQILRDRADIKGKQIIYTVEIEAYIRPLEPEGRGNFRIKKAEVFRVANPSVQKSPVFQDNDEIQMRIKVNEDAYLNIFSVDQYGRIIKLLPNPYVKSEIVPALTEFIYPDESQISLGIRLKVKTPKNLSRAIESVLIIATKEKVDFLSDKNQEEMTITDLMGELSELDPSLWIEKTVGYKVRR